MSLPHGARRVGDRVDLGDALLERLGRLGADGAAGRDPHMRDDDVGAGLGHRRASSGLNT